MVAPVYRVHYYFFSVTTSLKSDLNRPSRRLKTPAPTYREVACRRMATNPTLQHFQSSEMFNLCFDNEYAKKMLTDPSEYLVSPFLSLFGNSKSSLDLNNIVSFVGVNDCPVYRSSPSCSHYGKIVEFHAMLYSLSDRK